MYIDAARRRHAAAARSVLAARLTPSFDTSANEAPLDTMVKDGRQLVKIVPDASCTAPNAQRQCDRAEESFPIWMALTMAAAPRILASANNVGRSRPVPDGRSLNRGFFLRICLASQERLPAPRVTTAAGYSPCPIDRRRGARLCDAGRALFFCIQICGFRPGSLRVPHGLRTTWQRVHVSPERQPVADS